jgi:predicted Zn finger-like uncharacterized protein
MEISCPGCQGKFKLDVEKVPEGKTVLVKCPRCQTKIPVSRPSKSQPPPEQTFDDLFEFSESEGGDGYDASDKPFDFIEEEGKTALVCEADKAIREKIRPSLDILEYHVNEVDNNRDALKKMRYHTYDLIVVNEHFDSTDPDTNPILIYLERQPMELRRNTYITLLSSRFRTMDQMTTFQHSVNLIINLRNIDDFDKILQRGLTDHGLFYKVFKESMTHYR